MKAKDTLLPDVSIVMACYNGAQWLQHAIESSLMQTLQTFEMVIVDDGSTDESMAIIQAYATRDPRIVVVFKPHTNLTHSLNVGLEKAKGRWIARLDADDVCEPDRLEKQLRFVLAQPDIVLVGSGFTEIDAYGTAIREHDYPERHEDLVRNIERGKRYFPHSSAFFNRHAVMSLHGYNTLFTKSQDYDLWLRLSERGRIACLREKLVRIRIHSGQISTASPGISQAVFGTSAVCCHFLRLNGSPDVSGQGNPEAWFQFLTWLERRMVTDGFFARRAAWIQARKAYLAANNGVYAFFVFSGLLLGSGHFTAIILEKILGSRLAKRLAKEWMKQQCAA